MSKGIEINGQLRGKRGGVVYYRSSGQQISRAKAENVSNPNTQPQRIQRMIMATVMQAYSLTKEITDHSFEGIKYKQDSMAFFQRVNANKLRAMISAESPAFSPSFTAPKLQALIPNGYTISRGSLAPVPYSYTEISGVGHAAVFGVATGIASGGILTDITNGQFMTALTANAGDMITLVWLEGDSTLYQYGDEHDERAQVKYVTMRYVRMKFKETLTAEDLAGHLFTVTADVPTVNADIFDVELCSNLDLLGSFSVTEINNSLFLAYTSEAAHACGAIRSRRSDGAWRRSICEMAVNPDYDFGLSYEYGVLAWEKKTTDLGNGEWLLNDKVNSSFSPATPGAAQYSLGVATFEDGEGKQLEEENILMANGAVLFATRQDASKAFFRWSDPDTPFDAALVRGKTVQEVWDADLISPQVFVSFVAPAAVALRNLGSIENAVFPA